MLNVNVNKDWFDYFLSFGTLLTGIGSIVMAFVVWKTNRKNIFHSNALSIRDATLRDFIEWEKSFRRVMVRIINAITSDFGHSKTRPSIGTDRIDAFRQERFDNTKQMTLNAYELE